MKYEIIHQIKAQRYLVEVLEDEVDNLYSSKVFLFPFEIISGGVWLTNNGLRDPLNFETGTIYSTKNNTQATFVINGNEPLSLAWLNSYFPTYNHLHLEDGFTKNFRVGDYFTCFVSDNFTISKEESQLELLNQTYLNLQANRDIFLDLYVKNDIKLDEEYLLNKVYVIQGGDFNNNKLYKLINITVIINQASLKTKSYHLHFQSINFDYAQSGKQIFQGFNFGFAGANFAFPAINENGDVVLNETFLNENFGITSIQETRDFAHNFCTWEITGGLADNAKVLPLQKLLVYEPLMPINDNLQLQGSATNNYFVWWNAKPSMDFVAESFKTPLNNANFNNWSREVVGGLSQTRHIENTNPLNNGTYTPFYNRGWSIVNNTNEVITFNNLTSKYIGRTMDWEIPRGQSYNIAQFWNNNSIIYENYTQYTTEITQSSKFSFGQVPILGKLWNILNLGFDPVWNSLTNIIQPSYPLNLITPISQYNLAAGEAAGPNVPINLNFFNSNESNNSNGGKMNMGSIHFSLTDRMIVPNKIVANYNPSEIQKKWDTFFSNQPQLGIYNTYYIGQNKNPDGSDIEFPVVWYDSPNIIPAEPSSRGKARGFYIGAIKTYGVGANTIFLTFYTNQGSTALPSPVYFNIMKSNALTTKIMPFWSNVINFNAFSIDLLENVRESWPNVLSPSGPPNTSSLSLTLNQEKGTPTYSFLGRSGFNADTSTTKNSFTNSNVGNIVQTNFNALFGSWMNEQVPNGEGLTLNATTNLSFSSWGANVRRLMNEYPEAWKQSEDNRFTFLDLWSELGGQRPQQNTFEAQGQYFKPLDTPFRLRVNVKNIKTKGYEATPIQTPFLNKASVFKPENPELDRWFSPIFTYSNVRDINFARSRIRDIELPDSFWNGTPFSVNIPISLNVSANLDSEGYQQTNRGIAFDASSTRRVNNGNPLITETNRTLTYFPTSTINYGNITNSSFNYGQVKETDFATGGGFILTHEIKRYFFESILGGLDTFTPILNTNNLMNVFPPNFITEPLPINVFNTNNPQAGNTYLRTAFQRNNPIPNILKNYRKHDIFLTSDDNNQNLIDNIIRNYDAISESTIITNNNRVNGGSTFLDTDKMELELIFNFNPITNKISYTTKLWVPYRITKELIRTAQNNNTLNEISLRDFLNLTPNQTLYNISTSPLTQGINTQWDFIQENSIIDVIFDIINITNN